MEPAHAFPIANFLSRARSLYQEFLSFFAILSLVLIVSHVQGQCPGIDIVQDPEDFVWTYHPVTESNLEAYYSGLIEVGVANLDMNNGETLTTRAYRQQGGSYSIPGPTITVLPGNKYVLRFHNTLPYAPINPDHNIFKDANVSNLHTHGLHISGESPGDDVTRSFEGERGGDFVWDIPTDHMGGTFWYHAHHHGSTFLQVSGGLFGLLIVDDSNDGIPSTVSGMTERELVLGYLDTDAAGTGGDELLGGSLSPTWTVNGLVAGHANICMPPNTWQHWRVLLADRQAKIRTIEFGPECEVMLLARDGVWRTVAPKDLTTLNANQLELTGASRADFAVRVNSASSWIMINSTVVANIYTEGTPDPSVHPFHTDGSSSWSATRPDYLRDLRDETNVNFESVSMGARTINGSKWDIEVPTLELNTTQVQEWSLSGAVQHPFHLHIYHVQALKDNGDFEEGEYYDVVAAKMDLRFDLNTATSSPYDGRTVMHCHILSHEDQGAMGWLDVDGGTGPPTFPSDGDLMEPYSEYYVLSGGQTPAAPSDLVATAVSSSAIGLTWLDNSADEDGLDIERSTNGTNFSSLTSVGVNVTAYTDNGLTPSTTYWYRVSAVNSNGSSGPSNTVSATTQSSGGGPIVHVDDIIVQREALKGNRFRAIATVIILDDVGTAVSGAVVDGIFTGPTSVSRSATTDGNGQVTLNSNGTKNPVGEWCFEVTDVSISGGSYDNEANVVTKACENGSAFKIAPLAYTHGLHKHVLISVTPNPFRNWTKISLQVQHQTRVRLEVYNLAGTRVGVISDHHYDAGRHVVDWNTRNLNSGTYFLQLRARNQVETKKLVLIR